MMRHKYFRNLLLVGLSFLWVACSNQWRTSDIQIDGKQLNGLIENAISFGIQSSSTNTNDLNRFEKLYADPNSRVYYTEGPSPEFGSVEGATPIFNWSFMGDEFANLSVSSNQIKASRVYFVERLSDQGLEFGLMFELQLNAVNGQSEQRIVKTFFNSEQPLFDEGEMVLDLSNSEGKKITFRSFDVVDDLLADIIQLEVYLFINGEETPVGKISTLVSFN